MDAITVGARGSLECRGKLRHKPHRTAVKLLNRFTRRIVVNYDPDTAGQAATERSLSILLEQGSEVRVLALPGGKDRIVSSMPKAPRRIRNY